MRSQIGFGVVILLVIAFAIGLNAQSRPGDSVNAESQAVTPSAKPSASAKPPARPKPTSASQLKPAPLPKWPGNHKGHGPIGSMATTGTTSVALTFDDGPGPYTHEILDLLEKYHVKATFCMIGRQVHAYRSVVKRIIRDGDTLCNHSWDHDEQMGEKSLSRIRWEMATTNAAIHQVDPKAKVRYFRNPGGNFTKSTVGVCENMGMRPLYWSVDTRDWSVPGVNHIQSVLAANTHHGSIVLMHDGGGNRTETLAALRMMLPRLASQYDLIPLPTM
jgi:peptidoglycan/xylan/chitin deacetylase (PgdA/CDA1 family)